MIWITEAAGITPEMTVITIEAAGITPEITAITIGTRGANTVAIVATVIGTLIVTVITQNEIDMAEIGDGKTAVVTAVIALPRLSISTSIPTTTAAEMLVTAATAAVLAAVSPAAVAAAARSLAEEARAGGRPTGKRRCLAAGSNQRAVQASTVMMQVAAKAATVAVLQRRQLAARVAATKDLGQEPSRRQLRGLFRARTIMAVQGCSRWLAELQQEAMLRARTIPPQR